MSEAEGSDQEQAGAWVEAEKHLGKWQKLRPKAWAETRSVLLSSFRAAVARLADPSAPIPALAVVETWAQRWARVGAAAAMATWSPYAQPPHPRALRPIDIDRL